MIAAPCATIGLEHVADDIAWQHRHGGMRRDFERWLRDWTKLGPDKSFTWVKRVLGDDGREAVRGVPDYTNANSTGSKGVVYWYVLRPGVYEVNHRYKLNKVRRYWLISEGGKLREVSKSEAFEWRRQKTNAISASAS